MKVIVNDMNCKNCAAKIEKSLLVYEVDAKINLEEKSVNFEDEQDLELVKAAIIKAGYTPTL